MNLIATESDFWCQPENRLKCWSSPVAIVVALIVFVAIHFATLSIGFRETIDLLYYPAYVEASRGGWLCLFSMDSVSLSDLSRPYSGWPPLFGLLLGFPAKLGVPYGVGVTLVNAVLGLSTTLALYALIRRFSSQTPFILVLLVTVFCGAYWSSATMAFAHRCIPLGLVLGVLSWSRWQDRTLTPEPMNGVQRWGLFLGTCGLALLIGSMNWACFMVVPAVGLLSLAVRESSAESRQAFRSSILWCFCFGLGLVAAFVVFKILHAMSAADPGAIEPAISGNSSRIQARMIPTPRNVIAGAFFTIPRLLLAVLPLVPLLSVPRTDCWRTNHWISSILASSEMRVVASLILSVALYMICFTGEMAESAHRFYAILFLAPVAAVFLIRFRDTSNVRRIFAVGLCFGTTMFTLVGYHVVPARYLGSPRQDYFPAGYITPTTVSPFEILPEQYSLESVARTFIKQLTIPPFREQGRVAGNYGNKIYEWFSAAKSIISEICPPDGLIIGSTANHPVESLLSERAFIPATDLSQLDRVLRKVQHLIRQDRVVLALGSGPIPAEVSAVLAETRVGLGRSVTFRESTFYRLQPATENPSK